MDSSPANVVHDARSGFFDIQSLELDSMSQNYSNSTLAIVLFCSIVLLCLLILRLKANKEKEASIQLVDPLAEIHTLSSSLSEDSSIEEIKEISVSFSRMLRFELGNVCSSNFRSSDNKEYRRQLELYIEGAGLDKESENSLRSLGSTLDELEALSYSPLAASNSNQYSLELTQSLEASISSIEILRNSSSDPEELQ